MPNTMSFSSYNDVNEDEPARRKSSSSVRDLQAKAYAKWVCQGISRKSSSSSHQSGFEAERARRHYWTQEAARSGVVMRT
jgi:hypothetical protein